MNKVDILVENRSGREGFNSTPGIPHKISMKIMSSSDIKRCLRYCLGDAVASWIHAVRFCFLFSKLKQEPEIAILPTLLKEGDVAIDVGANGANWTRALSEAVGVTGKVYAFEADPYYARVTRNAIKLMRLRNVQFFSFGLSDSAGSANLRIKSSDGNNLTGTQSVVQRSGPDTIVVQMVELDSIAQSHPEILKVRVLKCDVEGHEPNVFRGGRKIIQGAMPTIVTEAGALNEVSDLLFSWGYVCRSRIARSPNLIFEAAKERTASNSTQSC